MTEKTKSTKPGFMPAARLGTLIARPGFKARWVENTPDRISKMRSEGWIVMKESDNKGSYINKAVDATDAKALSDELRFRNMIGMMLPDDILESRREYYKKETIEATKAILKDGDKELRKTGARPYTPNGAEARIVIE